MPQVPILVFTALGLAGAVVIAIAYLLNQCGRLASTDWRYPGANLLGTVLILFSFVSEWNTPSLVIEIFWAGISIFGLCRALVLRRRALR